MDLITCNSTAQDWIDVAQKRVILEIDQLKNSCWPWKQFGSNEWMYMNERMKPNGPLVTAGKRCQLCISLVGLGGSLLCMATVWRKAIPKRERFYRWMFSIALLDFFYNIAFIWLNLPDEPQFLLFKSFSYGNAVISMILKGLTHGFSFASDLCTLCLTIERFMALRVMTGDLELNRMIVPLEVTCILVVASTRAVVLGVQRTVAVVGGNETTGLKYDSAQNPLMLAAPWRSTLGVIINTIAPFVLLFAMILLSVGIGIIAMKRRKSKVFDSASSETQQEIQKQSRATISLCFCLSFLFGLNQLGYCFACVGTQLLAQTPKYKTFDSSYFEMIQLTQIKMYSTVATNVVIYIFECLSKSLNFFIYIAFVFSFREEFIRFQRRILCRTVVEPLY